MRDIEITDKELSFIENLRRVAIPYGEILLRLSYQDGVIVRIIIEDKKESVKL